MDKHETIRMYNLASIKLRQQLEDSKTVYETTAVGAALFLTEAMLEASQQILYEYQGRVGK